MIHATRSTVRAAVAAAMVALILTGVTSAQSEFPNRPISVVVPFSAGGGSDVAARAMAAVSDRYLPVPIQVVNMPGAGGATGGRYVAFSDPDGYTLLHGTFGPSLTVPILGDVGYTNESFIAIARKQAPTMVLVARSGLWETVDELIADALERPGRISYGSSGAGGAQHFPMEILQRALGIELLHVPFDGGADAMLALQGGHIDLTFGTASTVLPAIESGYAIALAHGDTERVDAMPEVPTFLELGHDFEWVHWRAIFAPAGTPDEVVAYLEEAFLALFEDEDFVQRLTATGDPPRPQGSEAFGAFYNRQYQDITAVAEELDMID